MSCPRRLPITRMAFLAAFVACTLAPGPAALDRPAAAEASATTTELPPDADARVTGKHPNENYGRLRTLGTGRATATMSFLRFARPRRCDTVLHAELRVFARRGNRKGYKVRRVANNRWSETRITSRKAPALGRVLGSSGPVGRSSWTSVDLTSAVRKWPIVSVALVGRGSRPILYSSREGGHPPNLLIETEPAPCPVRGVYDHDSSPSGFQLQAAVGFNFIDSNPYLDDLNALSAAGVKGFLWLGGYDNDTCRFRRSDDWVRERVTEVAGHHAIGAYFVDDEPDAAACPAAPTHMRRRSDLVKSLDPGATTFLVDYKVAQLRLWAGTVDIIGLNHYPCIHEDGCRWEIIDEQIAEADRLGLRYWAVIQAHGDDYYRQPTPDELREEFSRWRASNMEGYLVFSWRWPPDDPTLWLESHPELLTVLAEENAL